jgi:glycosyltransferase involved in cell wall biosynthesis
MKIIQVSPYFYPHLGGVESHVYSISKELVNRGHMVSVFTSKIPVNTEDIEKKRWHNNKQNKTGD